MCGNRKIDIVAGGFSNMEKICPIMSRPKFIQGNSDRIESLCLTGNELDDGLHYDGVIRCQTNGCKAWIPEKVSEEMLDSDCPGAKENPFVTRKTGGYCTLIPRS